MTNGRNGDHGERNQTRGSISELEALLTEFDTAMLVTKTPEGFMRARPMAIQDPGALPDCDLWFITEDESPKIDEISRENQVAVCCYRPRDGAYISISAVAQLDRRTETVRRLWKPEWKAWMPGGPESAAVLKLEVERAEYWEPEGGRLRVLFEQARALVKGRAADDRLNPPKHI